MPRRSASSNTAKNLPFKEITSKLGSDELIKRLKGCLKYLEDLEELEQSISTPLTEVMVTLVGPSLRLHKSKEVQLLTACILVNMLRLFYPDPPATEHQMIDIFNLFISQLDGLKKPSNTLFKWTFSLLELLAGLKVFNICLSYDGQDILVNLFAKVFSVVHPEQSTQVKLYLLEILLSILQDGEQIPQRAIDTILMNILEPQKTENPSVYEFACQLIKKASLFLEPHLQMFFTSTFVVGEVADSELNDHIYELIYELHNIDSSVLLSVLPQLEIKLKSGDVTERQEVTTLLGRMFSAKESQLSIENRPLWICFTGRFQDINPTVRLECVKFSKYFLVYHQHLAQETEDKLLDRLRDTEEKVRLETVRTICEAATEDLSCVSDKLLTALQDRMRDRKWSVRKLAMTSLARLYRQVMSSTTSTQSNINRINWIANKLLHCFYQPFPEDKLCVVRSLLSCIIPVSMEIGDKMKRLLYVNGILDDNATRSLTEILKNQKSIRQHVIDIVDIFEDSDLKDEEKRKLFLTKSLSIAKSMPEPLKCQDHLRELELLLTETSFRQHLRNSVNVSLNYEDMKNSKTELLAKLVSRHNLTETMKSILDFSSPILVDGECVKVLVGMVSKELCEPSLSQTEEQEQREQERCKKGLSLLKVIASLESVLFHDEEVLENILSLLRHNDVTIVTYGIQIMTSVGETLQEKFNNVAGCLQPILIQLSLKGEDPKLAKYSTKCLNSVFKEKPAIFQRLCESLVGSLDLEHPKLETVLASLSQLSLSHHQIFEKKRKTIITEFVIKNILEPDDVIMNNDDNEEEELKTDIERWCDDQDVSRETRLKITTIKLLVSWITGFPSTETTERQKPAKSVMKALGKILMDDGDLHQTKSVSTPEKSRLRLAAASGLLKLARLHGLNELMSLEQYIYLALTAQDLCVEVRDSFLTKLCKGIRYFALPLQYIGILCLAMGVESRKDAKMKLKKMMSATIISRRELYRQHTQQSQETAPSLLPEYSLPYVVYLISHHPSFSRTVHEKLWIFRDCLWFYLESLINKTDNFEFLSKLLETIKLTVDAEYPDDMEINKNIYATCDLAIGILVSMIGRSAVGNFPGKLVLPKRLFLPRKKSDGNNDMKYLPPDFILFPEKQSKTDPLLKVPTTTPTKRGRPTKRKKLESFNDSTASLNNTTMDEPSDIELTPSPSKRKKPGSSVKKQTSMKQTKLPFKLKQAPVTSTPVTMATGKPAAKGSRSTRQSARRQVLQKVPEEEFNDENKEDITNDVWEEKDSENDIVETGEIEENIEGSPPLTDTEVFIRRVSPRKRTISNKPDEVKDISSKSPATKKSKQASTLEPITKKKVRRRR